MLLRKETTPRLGPKCIKGFGSVVKYIQDMTIDLSTGDHECDVLCGKVTYAQIGYILSIIYPYLKIP